MDDKDFKIRILGDATGFGRAAKEVTRQINGIRDNIRNLPREAIRSAGSQLAAFFSVDWVASQVRQTMEYAGAIQDMSDRIGVGVEFLQELDYAAEQTGASLQDFVLGLREVQRSQAAALADSSGKDAKWFAAIGVSMEELRALDPEALFRRVARAMQEGQQGGAQMEAAIQLLGRSAISLLPAMRAGFANLTQEARNFGAVIEADAISRLDAMGDRIAALKRSARGLALNNPMTQYVVGQAEKTVLGTQGVAAAASGFWKAIWERKNPFTAAWDSFQAARESATRPPMKATGPDPALGDPRLPEQPNKPAPAPMASPIQADALQRIGLFIGGQSAIDIQRRQLTFLERMALSNQEAVRILQRGLGVGP